MFLVRPGILIGRAAPALQESPEEPLKNHAGSSAPRTPAHPQVHALKKGRWGYDQPHIPHCRDGCLPAGPHVHPFDCTAGAPAKRTPDGRNGRLAWQADTAHRLRVWLRPRLAVPGHPASQATPGCPALPPFRLFCCLDRRLLPPGTPPTSNALSAPGIMQRFPRAVFRAPDPVPVSGGGVPARGLPAGPGILSLFGYLRSIRMHKIPHINWLIRHARLRKIMQPR